MGKKLAVRIAEILNSARIAIENTLAEPEIAERVEAYGYSSAILQEGRARLQAAEQAVEAKAAAAGAQHDSTEKVDAAFAEAWDAYQALAKVARAVFKKDQPAITALELRGQAPRATAAFLGRAYKLFDNALTVPETAELLQAYGYDPERLQVERERIAAYDRANQAQEAAKGTAQQATRDQADALALLRDWYAQYRKIARVALRDRPQLLEKLGIPARTTLTKAQREARRRRRERGRDPA